MTLWALEPIKVSYNPVKFGGNRQSDIEDVFSLSRDAGVMTSSTPG